MDLDVPYYWDMESDGDEYATFFALYEVSASGKEKEYCVIFPFMAAWSVETEYYLDLSKEYSLEFKVYTVEQGVGFFEEFLAKDGKITVLASGPNPKKEDDHDWDYGLFIWECPFPFLGG